MSKYRIYELAKEFNTTSKVILDVLSRNHCELAKNHMSSVGDPEKDIIKRTFAERKPTASVPKEAPARVAAPHKTPAVPGPQAKAPVARPLNSPRVNPATAQSTGTNGGQQRTNHMQNQDHRTNQNRAKPAVSGSGHSQNYPASNTAGQGNRQNTQNRPAGSAAGQGNRPNTSQNRPAGGSAGQGNRQMPQNRPVGSTVGQGSRPNTSQNRPAGSTPALGAQNRPAGSGPNRPGQPNRTGAPGGRPNAGPGGNRRGGAFGQTRSNRNRNRNHTPAQNKSVKPEAEKPKVIKLGGPITVKEFAAKIGYEVSEIIKKLMMLGIMATINQEIDLDTATLIASEFEVTVEELPPEEDPTEIPEIVDDPTTLVLRPPVVTVMGHVDHGKTSLLDVIRKTQVTAKEAGGITQHIGAYQAVCQNKKIVFLDTPGHEAFTAMRARGAQVTDIAILVVAADDGVMPQTIEAINHAKSAKVPIIVAINKIDREGANPDHVKQQLSEYGLIPEDWGGDTIMVPVSARKQLGINELLEMILLVAEMQEIKANPNRAAQGIIIEAQLDKGRGPVATVLVQKGTLRVGDSIIAGVAHGKVRAMINDRGEKVKKAGPSMPVEVLGLADVPAAGDILASIDEKLARSIAEKRIAKRRSDEMMHSQKVSLDDLFQQIQDGNIKDLNILIKADVQGSVEALRSSLLGLNTGTEVRVNIIHAGAGAVNESDVMLATAANALIIAFNVRPDANARKLADAESIDIRTYRVIYEAISDVEAAMTGMLAPKFKEVIQGKAEIRQVMSFSKALVAGSYVLEGKITNSSSIRILRDSVIVYEGVIESLRRFKDDVKEVAATFECGITIDKFKDIKEGDIIEAFTMEEIKPTAQQSQQATN